MALSQETKSWLEELKSSGNLSDEAFNQIKTSVEANSKADDFIKGSQLRQADYSRQMASVQTAKTAVEEAQTKLQEKEAQVTKYQADLGTWKQGADEKFRTALKEREDASRKAAAAVARLKSMAVANGIDENEVLKDLDVVIPPASTGGNGGAPENQVDTSKFVTHDQVQSSVRESALIDASIHDLAITYQELTGKPLRDASKLVMEAIQAKMPLMEYAAKKFDFAKLEADKTEASVTQRIADAVKAREAELVSSGVLGGQLPTGRSDITGSPIFSQAAEGKFAKPSTGGDGGVSAAVAAFNVGKHKPGGVR